MEPAIFISQYTADRIARSLRDAVVRPQRVRGELQGYTVVWAGAPLTNQEVEEMGL